METVRTHAVFGMAAILAVAMALAVFTTRSSAKSMATATSVNVSAERLRTEPCGGSGEWYICSP